MNVAHQLNIMDYLVEMCGNHTQMSCDIIYSTRSHGGGAPHAADGGCV